MSSDCKVFMPRDASAYLSELGVARSTSTLAKDRVHGTGPRFLKIGSHRVGYYKSALDEFAASLRSEEFASTSDASEVKRQRANNGAAHEAEAA